MRRAALLLALALALAGCDPELWQTPQFTECMTDYYANPRGVTVGEAIVECEVEAKSRIEWGY